MCGACNAGEELFEAAVPLRRIGPHEGSATRTVTCNVYWTEENSVLIDADANVEPRRDQVVFYKSIGQDKLNRDVGLSAIPIPE